MILFTKPSNFTFNAYLRNQSTDVEAQSRIFICCFLRPHALKNGYRNQYHLSTTHTKINTPALQKDKVRPSKAELHNNWEEPDFYEGHEANHDVDEDAGYMQQLIEEVELMLTPEERAILQKNKVPDFKQLASPKWILLHTLATSGQILLMDGVLKYGIDVNSVDKYGLTALQKVVLCKKEAMISHLLKRGADLHVRDKDGASLLHYAVLVNAIQTLKLLIKNNLDVNIADNEGWTPLHLAVQSRVRDVAKILLLNGADKTIKNKGFNEDVFSASAVWTGCGVFFRLWSGVRNSLPGCLKPAINLEGNINTQLSTLEDSKLV